MPHVCHHWQLYSIVMGNGQFLTRGSNLKEAANLEMISFIICSLKVFVHFFIDGDNGRVYCCRKASNKVYTRAINEVLMN